MAAWKSQGNLSETTFPWLLVVLFAQKKTGVLELVEADVSKKIHFQDGLIVFASSSDRNDRLGELLLRRGILTFHQLQKAIEHIGGKERFGGILVRENFLSPQQLIWAVREQIREIVLSVFPWTFGHFDFQEGPLSSDEIITLELPMELLVKEGISRLDRWTDVFEGAGPLEESYTLFPERERAIPFLQPTDPELMILDILRNGCTGLELLEKSPLTDFETLKFLWSAKVVRLVVSEMNPLAAEGEEDIIAALLEGIVPLDDPGQSEAIDIEDDPVAEESAAPISVDMDSMATPLPGSIEPISGPAASDENSQASSEDESEDLSLSMPEDEPQATPETFGGLDLDLRDDEVPEQEESPEQPEPQDAGAESLQPEDESFEAPTENDDHSLPEEENPEIDMALDAALAEETTSDSESEDSDMEPDISELEDSEQEIVEQPPEPETALEEDTPEPKTPEMDMEMETASEDDSGRNEAEVPLDQVGFDMEGMEMETFDEEMDSDEEEEVEGGEEEKDSSQVNRVWIEGGPTLDMGVVTKAIQDLNIFQKYLSGFLQVEVRGNAKSLVMKSMNQVGRHNSAMFFKVVTNMDGTFPEGILGKNIIKNKISEYVKLFNLLLEEQLLQLADEAGDDRAKVLRQSMVDLKERSGI